MKIAIIGSRDYPDLHAVQDFVKQLPSDTVVVSGGAKGVDKTAENAARERGLQVIVFPAKWKKHGKRAGLIRNQIIVDEADEVVAFWCNKSRGTEYTIDLAIAAFKPVTIHEYLPAIDRVVVNRISRRIP